MTDRRSFLSGLVGPPLIGGGVTLIGKPTAAAVPVTDELHTRYLAWLAHEHRAAVREHAWRGAYASARRNGLPGCKARGFAADMRAHADYMLWMPDAPDVELSVASAPASSRAAVILSAAGIPLIGGAA